MGTGVSSLRQLCFGPFSRLTPPLVPFFSCPCLRGFHRFHFQDAGFTLGYELHAYLGKVAEAKGP